MALSQDRQNLVDIVALDSPFHVEQWYTWITDLTFETVFLPLPVEQANAILEIRKLAPSSNAATRAKRQQLEATLHELEASIDSAIAATGATSLGAFVRLSSRSPKDAAMRCARMADLYAAELQAVRELYRDADDSVIETIAFTRSCGKALRVESGKQALELFVASQRVHDDIAMSRQLRADQFGLKLIVRKWESILQEWEFRCFVVDGEMTACTQYYSDCFVPELVTRKHEIQERLLAFHLATRHRIPISTYTIDYALDPHSDRIWIVEINNPPPVAGQALFDYENERDRAILQHGPFEFRILHEPLEFPMKDRQVWLQSLKERRAGGDASSASSTGGSATGAKKKAKRLSV